MTFFRDAIEQIEGYKPGEQPQAGKFIKLNTNENPYPPSSSVARAVSQALDSGLARYPDPLATAFRLRAADVLGVDPEWILCGNGSDDILTIVTRSLVDRGELVRLPTPSYILYRTLAELQGARWEEISFQADWSLDEGLRTPSRTCGSPIFPIPTAPVARLFRPRMCWAWPSR